MTDPSLYRDDSRVRHMLDAMQRIVELSKGLDRAWLRNGCFFRFFASTFQGGPMTEFDAKILAIANKAVCEAQEENRRLGIANVYSLNGTLVWQLPDGRVTSVNPNK